MYMQVYQCDLVFPFNATLNLYYILETNIDILSY